MSYLIHEERNDCFVYRIGGSNTAIPNVEYSFNNDNSNELSPLQTLRKKSSIIHNKFHGLIAVCGVDKKTYANLSSVEILKNNKKWNYLHSLNKKRRF